MGSDNGIDIHYFSSAQEQDAMRVVRRKPPSAAAGRAETVLEEGPYSYVVSEEDGKRAAYIVSCRGSGRQVDIPARLGDAEVVGLRDRAFAQMGDLEELRMPQTVRECGKNVFSNCRSLKRIEYSDAITHLDATVMKGCRSLESIHLPANLVELKTGLLTDCPVAELVVPRAASTVDGKSFNAESLVKVTVDAANTTYESDGKCLYSKGYESLLLMCVACEAYEVASPCKEIADRAFRGVGKLGKVVFNAGLERVGAFAFFGTSLREVEFPRSLRSIGTKAFCQCKQLERASFNEGLLEIGDSAFAQTALRSVRLPKTLSQLGTAAFEAPGIDYASAESFFIDEENDHLKLADGVLYRNSGERSEALRLLGDVEECKVSGTADSVAPHAFENQRKLKRVVIEEGVTDIGDKAFKGCSSLEAVVLPESLERIGSHAFWGTALRELRIGASVEYIGECALCVSGDSRMPDRARIEHLEVDGRNSCFEVAGEMLVEHRDDGDTVVLYLGGPDTVVDIPEGVVEVADLAFYHSQAKEVHIPSSLAKLAPRGFLGLHGLQKVHVAYNPPLEGCSEVVLEFTPNPRDKVDMSRPLSFDKADGRFFDYDAFDSMATHEYDPVDVGRMVLSRLEQPIKLKKAYRASFDAALKGFLPQIVEGFEERGEQHGLELLERFGYLDAAGSVNNGRREEEGE